MAISTSQTAGSSGLLRPLALLFTTILFLHAQLAASIQVSPNSPCASLCIDNSSLDVSDPNSSTTQNSDMSCEDADFANTSAGQKWTACMGCLQNSTFSQNGESDQGWFFYNLRYNVDYCVFGYPNASNIGSSPCQTSTACGPLQDALFDGIPSMGNLTEYDYCSADSGSMTSNSFKGCEACVSASGDTNILANSLIALQAGCIQQLPTSAAVGLSGSVFTTTIISIVSPTVTAGSGSGSGSGSPVATTTIVIIVVVALLIVAAVAGFSFVCYRKRRAHNWARKQAAQREAEGEGAGDQGIGPTNWKSHYISTETITSPLSFQCRADRTSANTSVDETASSGDIEKSGADRSIASVFGGTHNGSSMTVGSDDGGANGLSYHEELLQQQQMPSKKKYSHSAAASVHSLPAIVESPFPSPAQVGEAQAAAADGSSSSSSMRIHSTDFDKQDYQMTDMSPPTQFTASAASKPAVPALPQLKTSFPAKGPAAPAPTAAAASRPRDNNRYYQSPQMLSAATLGSRESTPTSATALLSHAASNPQLRQQQSPPSGFAAYNPADYSAPRSQQQRRSASHMSPYMDSTSPASSSPASYASPVGFNTNNPYNAYAGVNSSGGSNFSPPAGRRPAYQGWAAMVAAAQQDQQRYVQQSQQSQQGYGQQGYGQPQQQQHHQFHFQPDLPSSASSSLRNVPSARGLGAATMAASHSRPPSSSGSSSEEQQAAASENAPLPPPPPPPPQPTSSRNSQRSTASRPDQPRPDLGLGIVGGGLPTNPASRKKQRAGTRESGSPVDTLAVQTDFLPPPPPRR